MDWLLIERVTSSSLNLFLIGIGIIITWKQFKINKDKQRIELFNESDQIYTLLEASLTEMLYKRDPRYTVYSDYHKIEREVRVKIPVIKDIYYELGDMVSELAGLNYEIEMIKETINVAVESEDDKDEYLLEKKNVNAEKIRSAKNHARGIQ